MIKLTILKAHSKKILKLLFSKYSFGSGSEIWECHRKLRLSFHFVILSLKSVYTLYEHFDLAVTI